MKLLMIILLLLPFSSVSAAEQPHSQPEGTVEVSGPNYKVLHLSPGSSSKTTRLAPDQSGIFFLNDSARSPLNLEVDFGTRPAHCASARMKMGKDGVYRSTEAIEANQFVSVCFPFAGTYRYKAISTTGAKTLSGEVVVVR